MPPPQDPPALDAKEAAENGMMNVALENKEWDEMVLEEEILEEEEGIDEGTAVSSIGGDFSQPGGELGVPETPEEKKYTAPEYPQTFGTFDDASAISSIGIVSARHTAHTSQYAEGFKITALAKPEGDSITEEDDDEERNCFVEEDESAISAVADDDKWEQDVDGNGYGFRGFCACPHGLFGIGSLLLSLVAFVLTGSATDRCDFVKADSDNEDPLTYWQMPQRQIGLIKFETEPNECTYWFDKMDTAGVVYDETFQATRVMTIAAGFLSLFFIGFLSTTTCVAYSAALFRRLAFASLVFPFVYGISFITLGSDICHGGACTIGVGGLVMVLGVVLWLITSCMLSMVPDGSSKGSKAFKKLDHPKYRVILGIAVIVIMVIIAAIDLSVISFRQSEVTATATGTVSPAVDAQAINWRQAGETMMGPYPDAPEYVSLSGDATTMALIGKESVLAMEYDIVNAVWYPKGNVISVNTDRKGFGPNDRITKIRGSAVSLAEKGNVLAVGSSNWADSSSSDGKYQFGTVQIWKYDAMSKTWVPKGRPIYGANKNDSFAIKVVLSSDGNRLAVLASAQDGQQKPYVRVYQYDNGEWTQVGDDVFLESTWEPSGFAFSGDGSTLALGSRRIGRLGLVTVWKLDETNQSWSRRGTNIASGLNIKEDNFGASVDLSEDGSILMIGDSGVVPAYARVLWFNNGSWERIGKDLTCDIDGQCAHDVALSKHGSVAALTGHTSRQIAKIYTISSLKDDWKQVGGDILGPQRSGSPIKSSTIDFSNDGRKIAFGVTFEDTRTQLWQYRGDSIQDVPLQSSLFEVANETVSSAPDEENAHGESSPIDVQELSDFNDDTDTIVPGGVESNSTSGPIEDNIGSLDSFTNNNTQAISFPESQSSEWVGTKEHKKVLYFLFSFPPRLERFDIAMREFLPTVSLPIQHGYATAFGIDWQDQLYVGYGQKVFKYDLTSDTKEEYVSVETDTDIIGFNFDGDYVFVNAGQYFISFNSNTNTTVQKFFSYNTLPFGSLLSQRHKRILGRTPDEVSVTSGNIIRRSDVWYKDYSESGIFTSEKPDTVDLAVNFASAAKTWLFPDETRIVDDRGHIFSVTSSEHVYTLDIGEEQSLIHDIAWLGDDVMILLQDGGKLTSISQEFLVTGTMKLGYSPVNIAVDEGEVLTFRPKSNATFGIDINSIYLGLLNPSTPRRTMDPSNVPYTPDFSFVDRYAKLYILSRAHSSIFVMIPDNETYVETIPLEEIPQFVAYSEVNHEIYTFRTNGVLSKISLSSQNRSEVSIAALPSDPVGLSTAGKFIFVCDESGAVATHYTFLNDGTMVSAVDWNHIDEEYVWNEANRKMYFFRQADPTDLMTEHIFENGTIGQRVDSYLNNNTGFEHPIRVDPSGQFAILGSGIIHNARTLKRLDVSLSNDVVDIAFTGNDVRTIRNTGNGAVQIQRWQLGSPFTLEKVLEVDGRAHSIHALDNNKTVVVTKNATGVPSIHVLNEEFVLV